jgi:hypothetical protein
LKNYIGHFFLILAVVLALYPPPEICFNYDVECGPTLGIYFIPWGLMSGLLASMIYVFPTGVFLPSEPCHHPKKQDITNTLEVCLVCQRYIEKEAT